MKNTINITATELSAYKEEEKMNKNEMEKRYSDLCERVTEAYTLYASEEVCDLLSDLQYAETELSLGVHDRESFLADCISMMERFFSAIDIKYDHGIEITLYRNENAGCNSGEYHEVLIDGLDFPACACGSGCNGTVALDRLSNESYVRRLLGQIEEDPYEEISVESEYWNTRDSLVERGINPDTVFYYVHSQEPTGAGIIHRFTVRKFMSPEDLRRKNRVLIADLVADRKPLSSFRDADIVEVLETYNFDTAIDITDTLTDMGYISVHDLFREPKLIEGMEV